MKRKRPTKRPLDDYEVFRYTEQQNFLDELAALLGIVCFRPDYHRATRDCNTVLFYTVADHKHNCEVDKEFISYTRSEAADRPYHIDDKYIYRDHFWCFENTDVYGHLDYDFANFGKLDLRGLNWKVVIQQSVCRALLEKCI